jgi:tRNA 2-thiouridine synthesizing protein A
MSAQITSSRTLDCRGLLCPMPIIQVSKALKGMEVGQILEMLATDPGSKPDMEAWARQTGHELLGVQEEGGLFKFYVRRSKEGG